MSARRSPRLARELLVGGAALLAIALWSAGAEAKTTAAADLDYAAPIGGSANPGWGFGIRLGQQLHAPLIVVNPELGFTYHGFDSSPKVYRGLAGLRLGIGELLRVGGFVHAGIGRVALTGMPDRSHTAFTYDVGVFLDFTALPLLDVGVHAAYNRIGKGDDAPAFQFATAGAHAALVF